MTAFSGTPSGAWAPIQRACHRLAPTFDLEADLVAVSAVASVSTREDWDAGTKTNVGVNARGEVRLAPGGSGVTLLDSTGPFVWQDFLDREGGRHEYAIDVFIDPAFSGGQPITLDTLSLQLKRDQNALLPFDGRFVLSIDAYDDQWRRIPLGDPVEVDVARTGWPGGLTTIRFVQDYAKEFVFEPGLVTTRTGPGLDIVGNRRDVEPIEGVSQLRVWRGLSIGISLKGPRHEGAALGVLTGPAPFDTAAMWRPYGNGGGRRRRNLGPYAPASPPIDPRTDANLDGYLITGAVPGYGAVPCAAGLWGLARRVEAPSRSQNVAAWARPWVQLTARTFSPSGSIVVPIDLGATPTAEVQFRADDWVRPRTSIGYSLRGRNAPGDAWSAPIPVQDGAELPAGQRYRFYEVTAALAATPVAGGSALVSPVLQAVQVVERTRYRTEGLTTDLDADATIDPVTGQASIAELVLPLLRGGTPDGRDLATSIASGVSPSRLEAQLFGVCRRTGARRFLEAYRLESRTPSLAQEEFRFVSGLDRLQVRIPPQVETYTLPPAGGVAPTVSNVTGSGTSRTLTLSGVGATWTVGQLTGYRLRILSGPLAGIDYPIVDTPDTTRVVVALPASGTVPPVGVSVEIRSDIYARQDVVYTAQDPAAVYADVLTQLARVPRRLIGTLPELGRVRTEAGTVLTTDGRLKAGSGEGEGVTALSVLQALAVLLGGAVVWRRGRIDFVDLVDARESAASWDERDYHTLETPTGLDRRMPSVSCKFGKDGASDRFAGEVRVDDLDVIAAAGRANLFDVYEVDEAIATWCTTQALAVAVCTRLRTAFRAGPKLWRVGTVHQWPWLDLGDVVTIVTDQFSDRVYRFSPDGLVDDSTPRFGRTASVGVIVGKNLQADRFVVLVRDTIPAPRLVTGGGPVDGPLAPVPAPAITLTLEDGGIGIGYTPPASPYLDYLEYVVRTRALPDGTFGPETRTPGTRSGVDRLALVVAAETEVEVTPVTVTVGQTRRLGTPVLLTVPATAGGGTAARFTSVTVTVPSAPGDQITLGWSAADMPAGVTYTALLFVRGGQREYAAVSSGFQFQTGRDAPDATYPQEFRVSGLLFAIDPSGQTVASRVVPTTTYYSTVAET